MAAVAAHAAGHYIASESGQLLAATGPVASVARSVGEDLEAAGAALSVFAEEVTALQEQMEFRVLVIRRGTTVERDDSFLSPVVPMIENAAV
jgi:hypothetical protein